MARNQRSRPPSVLDPRWDRATLTRAVEMAIPHAYIDEELAHIVLYGHEIGVPEEVFDSSVMKNCGTCLRPIREGQSLSRSLAALNDAAPSSSIFAGVTFDAIDPGGPYRIGFDASRAEEWQRASIKALLASEPPLLTEEDVEKRYLMGRARQFRDASIWPEEMAQCADVLSHALEDAGLSRAAERLRSHGKKLASYHMLQVTEESADRLVARDWRGRVYVASRIDGDASEAPQGDG